jgi:hypothetical protein
MIRIKTCNTFSSVSPSGQSVSDLPLKFKDIVFILADFDTLKSILPLNIVVLRLDVSFGSKPCK